MIILDPSEFSRIYDSSQNFAIFIQNKLWIIEKSLESSLHLKIFHLILFPIEFVRVFIENFKIAKFIKNVTFFMFSQFGEFKTQFSTLKNTQCIPSTLFPKFQSKFHEITR